jgi:hypothetical protein
VETKYKQEKDFVDNLQHLNKTEMYELSLKIDQRVKEIVENELVKP